MMNISNELQKIEKLGRILELIQYAEKKIENLEQHRERWGFFSIDHNWSREIEITKMAKSRLENYYIKKLQSS